MNKKTYYSLGAQITGFPFYAGLVLLAAGIFGSLYSEAFVYKISSALLILVGLVLVPVFRGVCLNTARDEAFTYLNLLLFKVKGEKQSLSSFTQVELSLFKDKEIMRMMSQESVISTKSFDIHLTNKQGLKLLLAEFTDYKKAAKFLAEEAQKLALPSQDLYKVSRNRALHKRK
jgi:hypothetical protein